MQPSDPILPTEETDCCGSDGSRRMWGCLLGGLLLIVGVISGMTVVLLASGVARMVARMAQ